MKTELVGSINNIRAIEDCIRATKKYTKGVFTPYAKAPFQGQIYPSRIVTEYYEVYPETEVSWDMPVGVAIDWLWGDVPHIDVLFKYNYPANKAWVTIWGGEVAISQLKSGIKGLMEALFMLKVETHDANHKAQQKVGDTAGVRSSTIPHP